MVDYDKTNKGILYDIQDGYEVIKNGTLNIEGRDHRIIAVKRNNKQGSQIIELYRAIGTVKKNVNKTKETDPDTSGLVEVINVDGVKTVSCWQNISKKGTPYTSMSIRDLKELVSEPVEKELDDEIPF